MKVTLVRFTEKPLEAIGQAAANCYDSTPSAKIAQHCYKGGHYSVFEFADFHFHIEGVSRALSHQLVRHRIASFAQRSQRYVTEENFDVVLPQTIERSPEVRKEFDELMADIARLYSSMLEKGIAPEDARSILPNACETILDMKINLRALMNFMNLRLCTRAQTEIRQLAQAMKKAIVEQCPELEPYLVPKCEIHAPYSFCTESKRDCCGRYPLLKEVYDGYRGQVLTSSLVIKAP